MIALSMITFLGGLGLIGFAVKIERERRKAKQQERHQSWEPADSSYNQPSNALGHYADG